MLRIFIAARFLELLADRMVMAAVPLIVYQQTGSVTWSGLAFAVEWLPRVILNPFIGVVAGSFHPRRQFLLVNLLRLLCILPMLWLNSPLLLVILASIMTLADSFGFIAMENTVTKHLGVVRTASLQAILQAVDQTTSVLGPMIAGILIVNDAILYIFIGGTVGIMSALAITKFLFKPLNVTAQRKLTPKRTMVGIQIGWRMIRKIKGLWALIGLTGMVNLVEGVMLALLPALVVGGFNSNEAVVGLLLGLSSGVSIAVLFLVAIATRYFSINVIAYLSGAIMTGAALAMALTDSLIVLAAAFLSFIAGRCAFVVYMRTQRIRLIPAMHFAKTIGVFLSLILLPLPLSGGIVAQLGAVLAAQEILLFTCAAAIAVTFMIVLWPALRMGFAASWQKAS